MAVNRLREDSAALAGIENGYAPLNSSLVVPSTYIGELTTLPTITGVGTSATGTGDVTPTLPSDHVANDILLLFVQSNNQAATAPAGYAQLGPAAGLGTAAAAGGTRLTIFWKRDSGSESNPTVTDTGDHTLAQIMGVRNCVGNGQPFLNVGVVRKTTASTTGTASAGATPVNNCLVVNAFVHALDSASTVFSAFTNSTLGSVTEQIDVATADGNGGGIGVSTGTMITLGNFDATTVTMTSGTNAVSTFIMLPKGITSRQGFTDRQVFLIPTTETWIKPTAARQIRMTTIGSGASGSAGRNAATAAGGGGGGGGAWHQFWFDASNVASTATVVVGAGGAATANTDGAASNIGASSNVTSAGQIIAHGDFGSSAGASASGSGGLGGNGGGKGTASAAGVSTYGSQITGGGTGGTTALSGGAGNDESGGAGAGGGTTQATSAGGASQRGGGGAGGGRSNTNVGVGGAAGLGSQLAGGATAGANGTDSPNPEYGGAGAAGGTSAAGPGGTGGWPGGAGGGGGSQSGAQRGGAGADGCVVITTFC